MAWGSVFSYRQILQSESAECGLACLAMVCAYYGRSDSLTELRRKFPVSLTGSNLKSLMAIADGLGFSTRPVKCELDELSKLTTPAILHWDLDHYVVLKKVSKAGIELLDPARGLRRLPASEVTKHFTGIALELTPAPRFERNKRPEKVELNDLWSRLSGFNKVVVQLLALTLIMQLFGMLMPIANQIVIDDVIGGGDRTLLKSVIIGFALIAIVQTAIDLLRGYIQLYAGQRLSIHLSGNLLNHLLRLPTDFFERRHVGDILSRFGSLAPVQGFLTGGIIGVTLDAIMVIPAGIIMLIYSPLLSALVVLDIVIVLVVQWSTFGRNKRYTDEGIALSAKTQSIFLETIRAVRAIKLAGRETERHAIWQNSVAEQQNLSFRQAIFNMWGGSGYSLLMVVQGLAMLFLGAMQILDGHMTLGMLMAFQSYALQFSTRTKSLIGQIFTFRMLSLHLERLGDIVHADPEAGADGVALIHRPLDGSIELKGLDFRYSPQDPWILRNVNLKVEAGERVVLVGPSGGGKSTLLKLLCGLYIPTEGQVLMDHKPLSALGLKGVRSQIGVVMQDDQLLSGTIADNIAFFDAHIDMEQVESVCRFAQVHDDILRLPMGYHSLIGDMGSVLSGGQRQRLLLARALYRRPRVLFMDEGTANLDPELEDVILSNLKELKITQIMVAHRKAAIDFADRAYSVIDSQVEPVASRYAEKGESVESVST